MRQTEAQIERLDKVFNTIWQPAARYEGRSSLNTWLCVAR